MKFFSAILSSIGFSSLLTSCNAVSQQADIFYHEKTPIGPSMWNFGPDGLTIFSPDGEVVKKHRKESLCIPYNTTNGMRTECSYFAVTSDGHRYVWVAGHHNGQHHIGAFDIDTGVHAGDQPTTCSTPLDLEYMPPRREMWVRCASKGYTGEEGAGEMEVFSSGDLGAEHKMTSLNGTSRPYGRLAVHSEMGPYAYASSYNMPYISQIDLANKNIFGEYTVDKASGTYAMGYSSKNNHIYARSRVCCSCGTPESDLESCGRWGPSQVVVQTGPNANPTAQNGTCGTSCLGTQADTIGVVEFDTITKTFVGKHNINPESGFGSEPYITPDGEFILLMPNDGGQYVRVLKPDVNGQPSKLLKDIPVAFKGGTKGKTVVNDFAFLTDDRQILVLASTVDNDIVIVDFKDDFRIKKLNISPLAEESTAESKRQVEWAIGTNFVWINGEKTKEQYVIEIPSNIDDASVYKTIVDVTSQKMIYVDNYERARTVQRTVVETAASTSAKKDDDSNKDIAIAGVAIGAVGVVLALVSMAMVVNLSNNAKGGQDIETNTLGSKIIE